MSRAQKLAQVARNRGVAGIQTELQKAVAAWLGLQGKEPAAVQVRRQDRTWICTAPDENGQVRTRSYSRLSGMISLISWYTTAAGRLRSQQKREERIRLLHVIRDGWALFSISVGRQCRGRTVLMLDSLDELVGRLVAAVNSGDYAVEDVRRGFYAILPARVVDWRTTTGSKRDGHLKVKWAALAGRTRVLLPVAAAASAEAIAEGFACEEKPADLVWRLRRLTLRQFLLREIATVPLADLHASGEVRNTARGGPRIPLP